MRLFRTSLALQMAIATILGLLCGLIFGDLTDALAPYVKAYIMVLKITAVPYLIGAIIHGVGQLSLSQAKLIARKGLFFVLLIWTINVSMIYGTFFIFPKTTAAPISGFIGTNTTSLNFAELLIPENIFNALSKNIIPAIVIFSLLIGIALIRLKEKQVLIQTLQLFTEALTKITSWIARITPLGTFIIIANQSGTIQFTTVKQVTSYLILYILCVALVTFWIFPRLLSSITSISAYRFLRLMFPVLLLAYTTNMVIICLPYIIEVLRKETMSIDPFDEKAQTQIQGTVSVCFNVPLGSLFIALFLFFISLFYNTPLALTGQIELFFTTILSGLGASGVGSWINSLTFLLNSLNLPQDALSLFLTTLPFTSGFQAMASAMQITTLSLLIILSSRKLIQIDYKKFSRKTILTLIPIFLLYGTIKTYNPLPQIKNDKKSIYELGIYSDVAVQIRERAPIMGAIIEEDALPRILRTKKLKVGYFPYRAPFAFYNFIHGVVGYDIAFAYELAYDLGCALELVPMNYANIAQELAEGLYDIAMSGVSITGPRLKELSFTESYISPSFVFVTKNRDKKEFSSLESVKNNLSLIIGVVKGTSYEDLAKDFFPQHTIVPLPSPDALLDDPNVDAFLWTSVEAIAWSVLHKDYRVVFPNPPIGKDLFAYAVSQNSPLLLNYVNQWLSLKKTQGYTEKQYNLWVLEKTEIVTPPLKRWSLLRYLGLIN